MQLAFLFLFMFAVSSSYLLVLHTAYIILNCSFPLCCGTLETTTSVFWYWLSSPSFSSLPLNFLASRTTISLDQPFFFFNFYVWERTCSICLCLAYLIYHDLLFHTLCCNCQAFTVSWLNIPLHIHAPFSLSIHQSLDI